MKKQIEAIIRKAKNADSGAIASIYNEHVARGMSTMDRVNKSAKDVAKWLKGFKKNELLVVLEENHELVGWGIIKRYSDREGYSYAAETAVYLRSEKIGKGYGSYLKTWMIKECKRLGYHHLVAKIFTSNHSSIKYNLKLGYTIVGIQKEIGCINGKWIDVTILQLVLN